MNSDLLAFLERFRPDGCTTFVAIVPDGSTVAETFNGTDPSQAVKWIEVQNRARGIYFTVNPTPAGLREKPKKGDIGEIAAVWADIDPLDANGRPWNEERERLIALAAELHALETPPTFIVDSGNGIQPVWLLTDPIEANDEYRQAAESLCSQIESALGAKGTHNIDRLLRVPGTRNLPNAKKRALGRGEAQSCLLRWTWRRYSWTELERLAEQLRCSPPRHAVPCEPARHRTPLGDVTLPDDAPEPLEPDRLEALRAEHPDAFDLGRYDGDQSRQDLALASLACRLGWSQQDAWRLIIAVRGDQKAYCQDYIERTLAQTTADPVETKGDALFDLSHDGLALDLGRQWQHEARHVALWGKWLFWTGPRWEPDERLIHMTRTRDYLRERADNLVRNATKIWPDLDADKARAQAEAIAKQLRSEPMRANVCSMARSNIELVATVGQWDRDPCLFGTPAGTVDLRTGELRPARPEDYLTKITAVAPAPPGTPAPIWQAFLERIFRHDPELVPFIQRAVGYSLLGTVSAHVLLFCWGQGGNGKGVLLNTISRILGDYAAVGPSDLLLVTQSDRHPCDMAMLRGARFVTAQELAPGRAWDEPKLKSLTGGDPITARFMRQDFFTYEPQFTLWVAGNHKPSFKGVDEAIRRRVILMPFLQVIAAAERDPDLPGKLEAEWPAILRWAIDGCLAWQREGLNPPASALNATKNYLDAEDTLGQWLEERCVVHHRVGWTSLKSLYADWCAWAGERGHQAGTAQSLGKRLDERGLERHKSNKGAGFLGIGLAQPSHSDESDESDGNPANTRMGARAGAQEHGVHYAGDRHFRHRVDLNDDDEPNPDELEFYE